jgi:hypothetical protein
MWLQPPLFSVGAEQAGQALVVFLLSLWFALSCMRTLLAYFAQLSPRCASPWKKQLSAPQPPHTRRGNSPKEEVPIPVVEEVAIVWGLTDMVCLHWPHSLKFGSVFWRLNRWYLRKQSSETMSLTSSSVAVVWHPSKGQRRQTTPSPTCIDKKVLRHGWQNWWRSEHSANDKESLRALFSKQIEQ